MLPLSPRPEVAQPRYRQDRRRPRQTAGLGIRAIAVQPALAADDDDDDDNYAADHATAAARALRTAKHAHREAGTGRESLTRVVVLALAFVVVFVVALALTLAPVFVPAVGDTADVRAAVWRYSADHRRSCGRGDLRTDRGEPRRAQEGR